MNKSQFESEKSYLICLNILSQLLSEQIITDSEFDILKAELLSKYKPVISSLSA